MSQVKRKPKRRIKKRAVLALVAAVLFIYICFSIPPMLSSNKLKKLGYDKEAITSIKKLKLTNDFIDNEWYSDQLNAMIKSENFDKELIPLYLVTKSLSSDDLRLYEKLLNTYTKDQVIKLYTDLTFYEMTPLLVFAKIDDLSLYINDVIAHRGVNNANNFELSGSYLKGYENIQPVINQGSTNMLVNKRYQLDATYVPGNLVDMGVAYASKGVQMNSEAYDQFILMCKAAKSQNLSFYASSPYRSYETQAGLYASYEKKSGTDKADTYSARAGHSEHQTGLAADLSTISGMDKFGDTDEFQWMLANAHTYGWIYRYPEGKISITGYISEPWHWRYLGVELATKVYNSNLTYDEYYMLYLN